MIEPQVQPIIGFPGRGRAGTNGTVTADVVRVQIAAEADFAKYRGKLTGKIVLMQPARERPDARRARRASHERGDLCRGCDDPGSRARARRGTARRRPPRRRGAQAAAALQRRLAAVSATAEGVVAVFDRGSDSDMTARRQRPLAGRRSAPMAARSSRAAAGRATTTAGTAPPSRHAGGRALQPDDPRARQERARQGRAERRDEVPRRDHAERLQHHRGNARHRSRAPRRNRPPRRALRLGSRTRPGPPTTPPAAPR